MQGAILKSNSNKSHSVVDTLPFSFPRKTRDAVIRIYQILIIDRLNYEDLEQNEEQIIHSNLMIFK